MAVLLKMCFRALECRGTHFFNQTGGGAAARLVEGSRQVAVALNALDLGQMAEALHQRGLVRRLVPLTRQQHALLRARIRLRASDQRISGKRRQGSTSCTAAMWCSSVPCSELACTCRYEKITN